MSKMLKREYLSKSVEDTKSLASQITKKLADGSTLLLSGDLGAGKTAFTQGVGAALGVKRKITSPTFTIMKIYLDGERPLFHIDAYRLEGTSSDDGLSEVIGEKGITVIEWPDYIEPLLPKEYLKINFIYINEKERQLKLEAWGKSYCTLLEAIIC
jgi:tRNA threonylcarbamoyladenosine biosynthesis protein TsaE